jgi:hypothetical protein
MHVTTTTFDSLPFDFSDLAWIDGAIDAGKPIRLATPFDEVYEGSITWIEIMRIRSRGGTLILDGR